MVGVLVLLICATAWVGTRALKAKSDLEAAVPLVTQLKSDILHQKTTAAATTLRELEPKVTQAAKLTSDPIWRLAEHVPVLGGNLRVVSTLANASNGLVEKALKPLAATASGLSISSLKPVDGKVNVALIQKVIPAVDQATATINAESKAVHAVDGVHHVIPAVASARTQFEALLGKASSELNAIGPILKVMPDILGASGPRNYLILFQSNGELTAEGGTIGSMAVLRVDDGAIQIEKQASAATTNFPAYTSPVIPVPADLQAIYTHGLATQVQDITQTPDFDFNFRIAQAMWSQTQGVKIDGAIAIDTVALSELLKLTGPVPLVNGLQLTSQNALPTLLGNLYYTYSDAEVDAINELAATEVFQKLMSGDVNPNALFDLMKSLGAQHRLLLWSTNHAEQQLIKKSPYYGAPPAEKPGTDSFGVYYRDQTPSKMEYYLHEQLKLSQTCAASGRTVQAAITLTNAAPADAATSLPRYVTGGGAIHPAGDIYLDVYAYAPPGYKVTSVEIDGQPVQATVGSDGEYVVATSSVLMAPGASSTMTVNYQAPGAAGKKLAAVTTPTVSPTVISTSTSGCAVATTPTATPTPTATTKATSKSKS